MGRAHVMTIAYPAQGHVIPMMEVAHGLAENGIKVTFVNTEFIHKRIINNNNIHPLITLASIPDGLQPWDDRSDVAKILASTAKTIPEEVEALIHTINETEGEDEVTCVIVDYFVWPVKLAHKLKIKTSAFMTSAAAWVAFSNNAFKLVHDGIIDTHGTPLKQEMIQLSPEMPAISTTKFLWTCTDDFATQKTLFNVISSNAESEKSLDWILCNTSYELEAGALKLVRKCLPIGPLLGKSAGHFLTQDTSSLSWLDQQLHNSTIYVSFGSSAFLDEIQFREVALGLESTNMPFLWVVRQDLTKNVDDAYPEGFMERIKNRGKIVSWAPQQKILSHPSVACFLTHCGWNSTLEGVSNGVPFLCWPYFADQFLNETYIVNQWEVGLGFEKDETAGVIKKEEIKNKVEKLLSDGRYKKRALKLQGKTIASIREGGSSQKNFNDFIDWIKKVE